MSGKQTLILFLLSMQSGCVLAQDYGGTTPPNGPERLINNVVLEALRLRTAAWAWLQEQAIARLTGQWVVP